MPTSIFSPWLIYPKPKPTASVRLFCIPYAGGSAMAFRPWVDALPDLDVGLVEMPGHGIRLQEMPMKDLKHLVQAIATALLPHCDRPISFFGHSMGALLCFEVARFLRTTVNISPVHLFLSGHRAPQLSASKPPIHALPDPDFLDELRRLNGTPTAVLETPDLMQILLPALRADFAILETYCYCPQRPLECPITVFGGLSDNEASRDELEGWRQQTTAFFSLHMLPGDHFFIQSPQSRQVIAQVIKTASDCQTC